jgi:HPt (histidine-containing phosphotransfer) domain-containing protein
MSALPILDQDMFQELQETTGPSPDSIATIYTTFTANASRTIASLPLETLTAREEKLHILKGSAAMVGAARIAKLAADLHAVCADLPAHAMEAGIRHLEDELGVFRHVIDARLERLASVRAVLTGGL